MYTFVEITYSVADPENPFGGGGGGDSIIICGLRPPTSSNRTLWLFRKGSPPSPSNGNRFAGSATDIDLLNGIRYNNII